MKSMQLLACFPTHAQIARMNGAQFKTVMLRIPLIDRGPSGGLSMFLRS